MQPTKWWNRDLHMSFSDPESIFPTFTVNLVLAFIFPSFVSSGMLLNTSESLFYFAANSKLLAQWPGEGSKAAYGCN